MAIRRVFFKTEFTGGGGGALDSIDGDDRGDGEALQDEDAAVVMKGNNYYLFILDDDLGGAEDSPNRIVPDLNPGDKRWVLQLYPFILAGTAATPPDADVTPDGAIYLRYTA